MEEEKVIEKTENQPVLLSELFLACENFEKDPTDENNDKLQKMIQSLQVKTYIPILDKELIMVDILSAIPDEFDAPGCSGYLEMGKVMYGLLAYVVNLENDLNGLSMFFGIYDALVVHGVVDYILQFASKDYAVLDRMVSDAMSSTNITRLLQTASLFDEKAYAKWKGLITDLKTSFTPEMLDAMKKVSAEGSDEGKILANGLMEAALNKAYDRDLKKSDDLLNDTKFLKDQKETEVN